MFPPGAIPEEGVMRRLMIPVVLVMILGLAGCLISTQIGERGHANDPYPERMEFHFDTLFNKFILLGRSAALMLLAYKHEVDKFYAAVDWDLLGFFAGLFVVLNVMENAQVLAMIGHGIQAMLNLPDGVDTGLLLASSAVASSEPKEGRQSW